MAADKTDFTQGSILKKMVAFMIPILGALILQAAYGAVTFWWSGVMARHRDFLRFLQEARY